MDDDIAIPARAKGKSCSRGTFGGIFGRTQAHQMCTVRDESFRKGVKFVLISVSLLGNHVRVLVITGPRLPCTNKPTGYLVSPSQRTPASNFCHSFDIRKEQS